MRIIVSVLALSSGLALSGCVMDEGSQSVDESSAAALTQEAQLPAVSALLHEAIGRGDVVANPFTESGVEPYAFVSADTRAAFYQRIQDAGLAVKVALPTVSELDPEAAVSVAGIAGSGDVGAETSCGTGCEYQTVGYCEGALLDGDIYDLGADYGAYTHAFNYIPGSMVPFSAELHLPYSSSALGDYNFDYDAPQELYVESFSSSFSADRSKHRCCYWFWGIPSWNIQCSNYFYNEL